MVAGTIPSCCRNLCMQEKLKLLGDLEQENQRLNQKASQLEAEIADDPPVLDLSPSPDDAAAAYIALGTEPLAPGAHIDPNTLTLLQDHLDGSLQALAQHKSSLAKHKHICASSHPGHHAILQKLHTCWCALLERMAPLLQQLQQASAAAAAQQAGGAAEAMLSATSTTAAAAAAAPSGMFVLPDQAPAAPMPAAAAAAGGLPPALLQQQLQARLEVVLKALSLILRGLLQAGPCYLWNFIWAANSPAHSTLRWALQDVAIPPPAAAALINPLLQQQPPQAAGMGFMRLNGLADSSSSSGGGGGGGLPSPLEAPTPAGAAAVGGAAGAQLQGLLNHASSWPDRQQSLPCQPRSVSPATAAPTGGSATSGDTSSATSSGGSPCSGNCRPHLGPSSTSRGDQQRPPSAPYSSSSSGGAAAPRMAEGVGVWAGGNCGTCDMELSLLSPLPGQAGCAAVNAAMCSHHRNGPMAAAAGGGKGAAAAARQGLGQSVVAAAGGTQQQDDGGPTDMVWEALADLPLTFVEDDITGEDAP
jgi:hypothetical protein